MIQVEGSGRFMLQVDPHFEEEIATDIRLSSQSIAERRLLPIPFETVDEYLSLLEMVSSRVSVFGRAVMMYLAAAVSDFYVPLERRQVHKIQSSSGLDLHLGQVPKRLGDLKSDWCPAAFVVSFKLETDIDILMDKAKAAIAKYKVDAVVANILHTRKEVVYLVTAGGDALTIRRPSESSMIESALVDSLCQLHSAFMGVHSSASSENLEESEA